MILTGRILLDLLNLKFLNSYLIAPSVMEHFDTNIFLSLLSIFLDFFSFEFLFFPFSDITVT